MKKLLAALGMLAFIPGTGSAQLILNTGYDHAALGLVQIGAPDPYWIKIASYEPPAPAVQIAPARAVLLPSGPWAPPLDIPATSNTPFIPSRWLAPRVSPSSTTGPNGTGTSHGRPAYSLFRKCFCLLRGFANATLSIRVRADDHVQVWLNNLPNTLVAPAMGQYFLSQGGPLQGAAQQAGPTLPGYFREGRNCLYVLVEDLTGNVAFTLAGTVNAAGLMPNPAIGTNGNFGPCGCPSESLSADGSPGPLAASSDSEAIQAMVRLAEARPLQALAQFPARSAAAGGAGAAR